MKPQKKILLGLLLVFLTSNVFLTFASNHFVKAQLDPLFSDNFDTGQPNSQFTLGSNDALDNTNYVSPTHSLLVSPQSSQYSHANFTDTNGQIYLQFFYKTSLPSYSKIITLQGETAWISIYEDQYGIWIDWNWDSFFTNTTLTPNIWYNMTLSLYLDPYAGSNSSLNMWLNGTIIANQNMTQLDGYSVNQIVFEPNYIPDSFNNYDDIVVSNQPFISPTPTPSPTTSPTPSPSPSPTPTATPTPTPTPSPTASPIPTPAPTPTPSSSSTHTQTASPSPVPFSTPVFLPLLALSVFIGATLSILILYRKLKWGNKFRM
jgi:hypothetical protein